MGLDNVDTAEIRKRFLNRVNVSILRWLQENEGVKFYDENFIWWISEQMGESWGNKVKRQDYGGGYWFSLTMEMMTMGDFNKTLEIIEKAYQYLEEKRAREIYDPYGLYVPEGLIDLKSFEERMRNIMLLSEGDLGIFWKNGKFYLSGAKELDEALISDNLEWLSKYPETKKQFLVALNHYEKSIQKTAAGKDAITNSYTSIESLAKEFFKNDKSFDKNSDELVVKLNLPKEYKNVIHYYKQIANEYGSRHAGSDPSHKEVEAFVYLTGLLLRLMAS
jgi:hypothetical protein